MNATTRHELRKELTSRGFTADGGSPNETMTLDDAYLDDVDLGELLETMVARREKVFQSTAVVGDEVAKKSYHDVVQAIDAIKATLQRIITP
jgi:hypothetical protein